MTHSLSSYIECIYALRNLVRTGWMLRGIPPSIGETVSDHSFTAALLGLYISNYLKNMGKEISPHKTVVFATLHDLIECETGDIPSKELDILKNLKESVEISYIKKMTRYPEIASLLDEYYEQNTIEAIIARLSEKLATLIQAERYLELGYKNVEEIIDNTKKEINDILENLEEREKEILINLIREVSKYYSNII